MCAGRPRVRVLMLTRTLPPQGQGGLAAAAADLAGAMARAGAQVRILTPGAAPPPRIDGVSIEAVEAQPGRYSPAWWKGSVQAFDRMGAGRFDVVLGVSAAANALAARPRAGGPLFVFQAHGTSAGELVSKLRSGRPRAVAGAVRNLYWGLARDRAYRDYDVVAAVGEAVRRQLAAWPTRALVGDTPVHLIRNGVAEAAFRFDPQARLRLRERQQAHWAALGLGAGRATVIRSGVDLRRHLPVDASSRAAAKRALGLDPAVLALGSVAMFRKEKNHPQLVRALAALRQAGVACALLLVGDGPTRGAVEALVAELDLGGSVRFCGEQADVRPFLAAMDVGVLCSTAVETLPLFGLELMATGAPLVASRLGGLEELVEDGVDGLLFPPGDTAALVRQLKRCADPVVRARLSAAALRKAQGFCAEVMADRYAELFGELGR